MVILWWCEGLGLVRPVKPIGACRSEVRVQITRLRLVSTHRAPDCGAYSLKQDILEGIRGITSTDMSKSIVCGQVEPVEPCGACGFKNLLVRLRRDLDTSGWVRIRNQVGISNTRSSGYDLTWLWLLFLHISWSRSHEDRGTHRKDVDRGTYCIVHRIVMYDKNW